MKFFKLNGYPVSKNITKYTIDWDGPSKSKFQKSVKDFLRPYWERHVCYEELTLAGTILSLDFVNMTRRVAVEVHGDQHKKYVKYFHGRSREGFLNQIERDDRKSRWCDNNGLQLVEIYTHNLPLTEEWFKETYDLIL